MCVLISCEVGGDRVPTELVAPTPSLRKSPAVPPAKRRKLRSSAGTKQLPPSQFPGVFSSDAVAFSSDGLAYSSDSVAKYLAQRISNQLGAPLIANEYSLDLIDVTRSLRHRKLFPPFTRSWSAADRERLIEQIHRPYRNRVRKAIEQLFVQFSYVIHLSVRSFPLKHEDKIRRADVGLLYDPSQADEVDFCLDWIDEMYDEIPMLRVRRNYPRRGTTDSITKAMRGEFSAMDYIGIEIQFNRAWVGRPLAIRDEVIDSMCRCLQAITSTSCSNAA